MATVALHVVHSSGKSTPPLLSASATSLQPPPLEWSSSPLAANSSASSTEALHSSGSKSDTSSSSSSSTEGIPTPTDLLSNAAAAYANINRKRRVVWDLTYRSSCLSSPKHRYHPYKSSTTGDHAHASDRNSLETVDRSVSSSSSPSRRNNAIHHLRTSSRASFKPPRSILKCLRNAKVSQYSLVHSSPGKRALHPSPGGRTFFAASPTASPRRRSSAYFATSTRSPGRSPGRSPRVPSLSFGVGSKSPSLADITRLNGGGRKHTIAFPDLRATKPAEHVFAASNGSMMMSMCSGNAEPRDGSGQAGQRSSAMQSLFRPSPSNGSSSSQVGNSPSSLAGNNVGLGLGQPFEGQNTTKGEGSSNDADPRMHIISACHTLKHSLASPIWQDSSPDTPTSVQQGLVDEDCFDSQPFDFPPRNLEQVLPEDDTSSKAFGPSFPTVHLRELEAAYATIFQYAQVYIQAWYNVATPESASSSQALHMNNPTHSAATDKEDDLDKEFAKLAPLLLKSVSRDVYRALHPVPLPAVEPSSAPDLPDNVKDKTSPTSAQTKEARQALLHRSGLSNATRDEEISSSSPLAFPSNSPDATVDAENQLPEVPKRIGRSTSEMRRRRNEINVVEAALQAFGTLVTCERFWRYFDVKVLQETLCEIAQIPTNSLFKGPKHRDILSSYNWIIANQTLSTPAYMSIAHEEQPLKTILDTVMNAVMATIESSTKNGEKARRVLSESFRAIHTLVIAYPSHVVGRLISESYIGKVSFFAKYLCSPTKALRDNAALLLSAIAFAITANWDDNSPSGHDAKLRAQEMVSTELYKYWTLSPGQFEIDELSRHLNSALESRLPSDYHFVRLVVNTLPIILGRRFRKMERKGPHMWLGKAVELKKREDLPGSPPLYASAFHLMTFLHVTYAWTSSSKEVAGKHMSLFEQLKRNGEDVPLQSDGQKLEVGFWGLGDKALRVVAQNVDAVVAKPWDRETYANPSVAAEIDATIALVLSFVYAFTGLSYTAFSSKQPLQDLEKQQNPNLHRDLSKIWDTFTGKYMPSMLSSGVPRLRLVGWQTMHALLRAGDEHPSEDAALTSWSMDRVINWRMLAVYASQASQPLYPPSLVLAESVKPSEIPSLDSSWVFDHRREVTSMLQGGFKALAADMIAHQGSLEDSLELEDWIKNPDGHAFMPSSMSNCIRTFFNTLRAAVGQEESDAPPSAALLGAVLELSQFILCAVDEFRGEDRENVLASGSLSVSGVCFSMLVHLVGLLEQTFGTLSLQTCIEKETRPSVSREVAQSVFTLEPPKIDDKQACSAYLSLVDFLFKLQTPVAPLVHAVLQNIKQTMYTTANVDSLATSLWTKTVHWVASSLETEIWDDTAVPALVEILKYAPNLYLDSKPDESTRAAYAKILFRSSTDNPTIAWTTLQTIAQTCNEAEAFLAWAIIPVVRDLSSVEDFTFLEQVCRTASVAETSPQSDVWSLADIVASLTAGLGKSTAGAAARVLPTLKDTLVSLCKSQFLSRTSVLQLYQATSSAFEQAYHFDPSAFDLDRFSALFLCLPSESWGSLADLWNATYGTTPGTLIYNEDLRTQLRAALNKGFHLQLPGWPEQPYTKSVGSAALPDGVADLESIAESLPDVDESCEPMTIGDSQVSNSAVARLSAPPTASASEPAENGDDGKQKDTTSEESQEREETSSLPLEATQMPSLSQMPEIPDRSSRIAEEPLHLLYSEADRINDKGEITESLEDTDTSIIPETQVNEAARDDEGKQRQVTERGIQSGKRPSSPEAHTPHISEGAVNVSLTDMIPETQLPPAANEDAMIESPDVSEIEETQVQDQSSLDAHLNIDATRPLPAEQVVRDPEDRSSRHEVAVTAPLHPLSDGVVGDQTISDKALNTHTTQTSKEINSNASTGVLPSPASSVKSIMRRGQTQPRKRQIVEVVIPYRPWLPRYPSTVRSRDDESQLSDKSATSIVADRRAARKATMTSTTSGRALDREVSEPIPSTRSSTSRKQSNDNERKYKRGSGKMRLAEIATSRYSQERAREVAIQQSKASAGPTARQLKQTTSLPTIIHSRVAIDTTDNDSEDDVISSSDEEICVASSPHTRKRISQTADSVEFARKTKRSGSGTSLRTHLQVSQPAESAREEGDAAEEGPTSSSPTTAASQRPRTYSQSTSVSGTSIRASLNVASRKRQRHGSFSSKGTTSTAARTGLELAKLLTDGGESDIEEVLDDLSENQMKKLHQQLEGRLKRIYGVKPVKKRKRT